MVKRGKDNAHTTILIVIVLAVIIVGGGGLAFILFSAELPNIMSELGEEEAAMRMAAQLDYEQAVEAASPELCSQIDDAFLRDSCYHEVAALSKDMNLCDEITETAVRKSCILRLSAIAECSEIDNIQLNGECYMNQIISDRMTDSSICEEIKGEEYNMVCMALTTRDSGLCEGATGVIRDGCLSSLAFMINQTSVCMGIEDIVRKQSCIMATGGSV